MKVLIWFGCFFVASLINTILGYITGYKIGYIIFYIVVVFIAKKLCKKWDAYKSKEVQPSCGTSLEESSSAPVSHAGSEIRFCRKCGTPLTDSCRFCRKCGTEVISEKEIGEEVKL